MRIFLENIFTHALAKTRARHVIDSLSANRSVCDRRVLAQPSTKKRLGLSEVQQQQQQKRRRRPFPDDSKTKRECKAKLAKTLRDARVARV